MRKTDDYSRQTFDGISIWDAGVRLDFNKRLQLSTLKYDVSKNRNENEKQKM